MNKSKFILFLLCLILPTQFSPLESPAWSIGNAVGDAKLEVVKVRECIKLFLSTWLIESNYVNALQSFSEASFSNQAMFWETCAGYINDDNRTSSEAIKKGIKEFLADSGTLPKSKTLEKLLDIRHILPLAKQMREKTLNDVEADHFLVIHLKSADIKSFIDDQKAAKFLKGHLPENGVYVSFVPFGDGIVYFFWIQEGSNWKIYHASMMCM